MNLILGIERCRHKGRDLLQYDFEPKCESETNQALETGCIQYEYFLEHCRQTMSTYSCCTIVIRVCQHHGDNSSATLRSCITYIVLAATVIRHDSHRPRESSNESHAVRPEAAGKGCQISSASIRKSQAHHLSNPIHK
jgi:hypothetical protein